MPIPGRSQLGDRLESRPFTIESARALGYGHMMAPSVISHIAIATTILPIPPHKRPMAAPLPAWRDPLQQRPAHLSPRIDPNPAPRTAPKRVLMAGNIGRRYVPAIAPITAIPVAAMTASFDAPTRWALQAPVSSSNSSPSSVKMPNTIRTSRRSPGHLIATRPPEPWLKGSAKCPEVASRPRQHLWC